MGELYPRTLKVFEGMGITHVALMLGSNNCGSMSDKSPERFQADMAGLIADLNKRGYKVILMSIGVRQDSGGGTTPEEKMAFIQQYNAVLPRLANGKNVVLGETQLFDWQKNHLETLSKDHVHQRPAGSVMLAQMQADAIVRVLDKDTPEALRTETNKRN